MAPNWDYFDKVYCISLLERQDRQLAAETQFGAVGLAERVEFVIVPKHPTDCEQGIYESHMRCMAKGIEAGAECILIFEDDILFDGFSPAGLADAIAFLSSHPDWNMLFLGCMVKGSRRTAYPSILNIQYRSLTHAYVVHRRFARILVSHPWQGAAYDDFLRDFKNDQMYALYPSFAFQSNSRSDNERYLRLDRFRRLCGGFQKLQKLNAFYHRNRWFVLGVHALALLIIILLFK